MITFICTFVQKLLECCHHLGSLYILRGSLKNSDLFLKKGISIIEEMKTFTAMSCFLLTFAELEYKRQDWKESEEKLNEAMDQNKVGIVFI